MKARELMTQPVVLAHLDTSLEDIARIMLEHEIGGVPIVDSNGKLAGIVAESDFTGKERGIPFSAFSAPSVFGEWIEPGNVERIYAAARQMTARDIMTTPVITATEEETMTDLVERMIQRRIHRIPIVRRGVPVGMVTRHDLLKLMTPSQVDISRPQGQ